VAKILVADDNSNIQKMVGLALKDQGIDVVAVGNGEAAVRKISDIIPDLVLADVFMPVRNGYEVCQYVKQDPALAHIPVILLVGAFDPLDEQEAQRVGADGVLKKPFVPPDPLIAMVKAALARAGVSYSSEKMNADGVARAADKKGSDMLKPRPVPVPAPEPVFVPTPTIVPPESIAMDEIDMVEDVVSTLPAPVNMDGAPLAFANLMDNAGAAVDEDPGFTPAVHPELALERDWRTVEESNDVPEEEEEEEAKASWRRDANDADDDDAVAARSKCGAPSWREAAFEEAGSRKSAREEWDTPAALPVMTEAAATEVAPGNLAHPALTETPAAPFSAEAWNNAIAAGVSEASQVISGTGAQTLTAEAVPETIAADVAPHSSEVAEKASDVAAHGANGNGATRTFEHDAVATALDRFAGSQDAGSELPQGSPMATSAWEVQAQKASLLAATWDAPVAHVAEAVPAESELGLGEARNFAEKVEVEAPKELLAEAGEGLDRGAAGAAGVTQAPVFEERAAEEHAVAASGTEPVVEEHRGGEIAYTAEHSSEQHPSEQHAAGESLPAQQASETDSGYGAVPVENVDRAEAAEAHDEESAAGHFEHVPVEQVPVETVSQDVVAEDAPAAALESAVHAAADSAGKVSTDDVVARVLAGLSPEVMQAITRELLKPVVEAMVKEELRKKE
jgi:CheY-like chemotaxis protein